MEGEWIEINEDRSNLPEDGEYMVRFHTGSMSPKIVERKSTLYSNGNWNRRRFQGEVDWDYATHYKIIKK